MPGKQRAAPCLAPKNVVATDGPRGLPGKWWVQRDFSLFSLLMVSVPFFRAAGLGLREAGEGSRGEKGAHSFLPAPLYPRKASCTCPQRDKTGSYYLFMCLFIHMPSSFAAPQEDETSVIPVKIQPQGEPPVIGVRGNLQ